MAINRFARYRVQIRKDSLVVIGQKRTMRGVNYNRKHVRLPLVTHRKDDIKRTIAEGVMLLDEPNL